MFERIFGKSTEVNAEAKSLFPGIATIGNIFSSRVFGGSSDRVDKYHSWVFRAINLISQEVGSTTLRLYKKSNDGTKKELTEHPLLDLLRHPNPEMSLSDLLEWVSAFLDIDGNSYIFTARAGEDVTGKIMELWPLRSDWVSTVPDTTKKRIVGAYNFYNGLTNVPLKVEEVVHFRNFNPKFYDRKIVGKGVGTLQAAMDFVEEDETIRAWNKRFFKNGAVTSGVLKYAGKLTSEQKTQLEAKWRQQNEGVDNSNKTVILSGGVDWQPTQFNQRELAFIEQRKLDKDDIFLIFGVPKGLLMSDDVNLANAKQALWAFTRFTVRPRLQKIEEMLNATIVKAFGNDLVLEFDNPVPNDRELQLKEYQVGINNWLTPNEVRQEEGLEPIEGGDVFASKQPIAPADLIAPLKTVKEKKVTALIDDERTVRGEKAWNEMLKYQKPFEDKYRAAFAKYFGEAKVRAVRALTEKKSKAPAPLLVKTAEVGFIFDFLKPLQKEYYEKQGRQALSELGLVNDFVMNDAIKARLEKYNMKLAGAVTDTTLDSLKTIIADGIAAGEGTDAVSAEIAKYFDDAQKYRADRIARSETILASNSATEEAWKQSDVVQSKEWYTAKDERVCDYCDGMDGTTIDLSDKFFQLGDNFQGMQLDYRSIGEPPLHTQCRCVLLPVLK